MIPNSDTMVPNGGAPGGGGGTPGTNSYVVESSPTGTKLSQITPHAPTSPMDQIAGVIGGATDTLYSLLQLSDLTPAPSDLDFYVATTGSDSNPGTFAQPFLTHQYALNFAAAFNYLGQFFPTIHTADGTYIVPETIVLRELTGGISGNSQGFISCNPANPGNVVIDVSAVGPGTHLFAALDPASNWQVDGFQGNMTGAMFLAAKHGKVTVAHNVIANDPTNAGLMYVFDLQQSGIGRLNSSVTVTILATTIAGFFQGQNSADFLMALNTINLQTNTISTNGMFLISTYSACIQVNSTFTGSISSSPSSSLTQFSLATTSNGLPSDFPDGLYNDSSVLLGSPGVRGFLQTFLTAPPTGSNLPIQDSWGFFFDSIFQIPYLANDVGGNFFSTPLAGNAEGLPYKISAPTTGSTVTSAYMLKSNVLNPAGTLATLTVNLPTGPFSLTPPDGFTTRVSTSQTITAITFAVTDGVSAIFSAPSTLLANTGIQYIYDANINTWYVM